MLPALAIGVMFDAPKSSKADFTGLRANNRYFYYFSHARRQID
ncbi:hypothetical protein SVI_2790 [Shewanella violacea DSS12]|uniref:Uncharacterized protein n=1 Tax=Shewanella violacea (strain JCM 10179 / CIP 106290 / LMG 19151 / DSS12) TaxID=637905 RepID=D4ZM62_SHEVD|nr:hypothetical protein SVI_2790 [Shewanella violacea DSS12]